MKNQINIKKYLLITLCSMFIASCENSEINSEISNISEKEGFISTTGQSDSVLEENISEAKKPVLHMHYDDDLTEEEVHAKFDVAIAAYKRENINQNEKSTNVWMYRIATYTGTGTNNQTDGGVRADVYFGSDKLNGGLTKESVKLDNPGDDREGGWDIYLFEASTAGRPIKWVQIMASTLKLKGTDGWFVKQFNVFVSPWDQVISGTTGQAKSITQPNIWLDNETSDGWDVYHSNNKDENKKLFFP
ncbi:hypothetical protein [uncultured Aquimarina sp.]|uniref:hypothetical protein n=1 Tax=uncultured Aquimarina sp. TaxID=575652 RepID=UPI002612FEFA|nr:hypothetical protein [uncultured Aquimarina sp.]